MSEMKNMIKVSVYLFFLFLSFQLLCAESIVGSKHDLSASNYYGYDGDATTEICVFCHTPHSASTTIGAPMWNRQVTDTSKYVLYGGSPGVPNSISLACLSCHDGVSGQDSLSAVSAYDGHTLLNPPNGSVTNPNCMACHRPAGAMPYDIWRVGPDLTNDHPISIDYAAVQASNPNAFEATPNTLLKFFEGNIECATCHNVHDPGNGMFLRIANTQSALCTSCHVK